MRAVDLVLDDLEHLRDTWDDDVTEKRLRYDSGVLRRLLIDRMLRRAWSETGVRREPRVLAPDLKAYLGDFDRKAIVFAQAGGVMYRGVAIALATVVEGPEAPSVKHPGQPMVEQTLSRYVDGPTLVARGVTIKRSELIRYVANKLGGVHYDERRRADDRAYLALDNLPAELVLRPDLPDRLDMRYLEMLAIGRHLAESADIRDWMQAHGR